MTPTNAVPMTLVPIPRILEKKTRDLIGANLWRAGMMDRIDTRLLANRITIPIPKMEAAWTGEG